MGFPLLHFVPLSHKDQPTLLVGASPHPRPAGLSSLKLFSLAGQAG